MKKTPLRLPLLSALFENFERLDAIDLAMFPRLPEFSEFVGILCAKFEQSDEKRKISLYAISRDAFRRRSIKTKMIVRTGDANAIPVSGAVF